MILLDMKIVTVGYKCKTTASARNLYTDCVIVEEKI